MERLGHSILQVAGIVFVLASVFDFTATLIDREVRKALAIADSYAAEQRPGKAGIQLAVTANQLDKGDWIGQQSLKGGR